MNLLADIPVTPDSLFNVTGVLALFLFIAEKAKNLFSKPKETPQPFVTQEAQEHVTRGSYESHCRINREEHGRIEAKLAAEVKAVEEAHHALAGDVREMKGVLESNGVRLLQMDQKIDRLLERRSPNA